VKFGDLARRLATAAVALPLLILAIFRGPALLLVGIVAVGAGLGLWEFYSLLEERQIVPLRAVGFAVMALLFVPGPWPGTVPAAILPAAVVLILAGALSRGRDMPGSVSSAAGTFLGAAYLGALGGTLGGLRTIAPEPAGPWIITMLFTVVMMADSAAYFVGSAVGRHKLAPTISPGKSVEGVLGGIAGGVLGALLIRRLGLPLLPLGHAIVLGVMVTAAGTAGDLVESLMKRWAGVKDSGRLFPGHGGMLDRLDSLLFAAPVLYYYFLYAYAR
jgi:phosphatidate cytidylyltransferase